MAPHRRKRIVFIALAIVVVAVTVFIVHRHMTAAPAAQAAAPRIPVVTATARKGDIGVYVTGLGAVVPLNTINIKTRVDGQLMTVFYKEGQTVNRGDPLVDIDPRVYQVQLEQAEAQLARDTATLQNAQTDLQRYQTLIAKNAVARQVLDTQVATVAQDEAVLKTDQANIDSAKLNIAYCHIIAPISGRTGLRLVDAGNLVSASAQTPLVVITQTQPISVLFTIPEEQLSAVRAQLKAGRVLPVDAIDRDLQKTSATGQLATLDNEIDQTTGTLRLRATFANTDDSLFPNQFVNARLLVRTETGVTLVPNAAVQRNTTTTFVYVVKPDQTVSLRNVTVGVTDSQDSEVTEGVAPGDVLVTQGVDRLRDGAHVTTATEGDEDQDAAHNSTP